MLEQVLIHLNNWFTAAGGAQTGTFTVQDGHLTLPFLQNGQYFRVVGSVFNDGLHQCPADGLTDETFEGSIWPLAIPQAVLSLADEIAAWNEKNGAPGPYASESFGGYSYTRATGAGGQAFTWQDAFRARLNAWRRIGGI